MSETINPFHQHPHCDHQVTECRVTRKHWIDSLVDWTPVYDGAGVMLNSDPNRFINEMTCITCGRVWQVITERGESRTVDKTPTPA
jgi:hypothetical protein